MGGGAALLIAPVGFFENRRIKIMRFGNDKIRTDYR